MDLSKLSFSSSRHDPLLTVCVCLLTAIGLLMVASSSIVVSERFFGSAFHYLINQMLYLGLGIVCGFAVYRFEMTFWQASSRVIIVGAIVMLALVLIPGIGHSVNGSRRWLGFGPLRFQISEIAKLSMILYVSAYAVRFQDQLRTQWMGFLKPLFVLAVIAALLLREPDFGATVVITATTFGILFLAGARVSQFMVLCGICLVLISLIAFAAPYRLLRLTTFLDPWANQYDSGYQLTQSLIAFGRGGWFGVGLGESIQKLFYLPEAHTDFLFAVLTEEFGLIGALLVVLCFAVLVTRAFMIGRYAYLSERLFNAYVAYGIAFWIGIQVFINVGVNSGILPTKGLTLPLMSAGGSSMLIMCIAIAFLFRVDFENRQ